MAWPPPVLPVNRTNATPQLDTHAADHNAHALAINDIVARLSPPVRIAGGNAYQPSTPLVSGSTIMATTPPVVAYDTSIWISASGWVGSDAGAVDGMTLRVVGGTPRISPNAPSAPANRSGTATVHHVFAVPASTSAAFSFSVSWIGSTGGTTFVQADMIWHQFRL